MGEVGLRKEPEKNVKKANTIYGILLIIIAIYYVAFAVINILQESVLGSLAILKAIAAGLFALYLFNGYKKGKVAQIKAGLILTLIPIATSLIIQGITLAERVDIIGFSISLGRQFAGNIIISPLHTFIFLAVETVAALMLTIYFFKKEKSSVKIKKSALVFTLAIIALISINLTSYIRYLDKMETFVISKQYGAEAPTWTIDSMGKMEIKEHGYNSYTANIDEGQSYYDSTQKLGVPFIEKLQIFFEPFALNAAVVFLVLKEKFLKSAEEKEENLQEKPAEEDA